MTHILVIWTIVALHGSSYGTENAPRMDWRPLGELRDAPACHAAAKALNILSTKYRCIDKRNGEVS